MNKPLTIAIVGVSYPYRGGISLFTTLLSHELMKKHSVYLVNFKRQYPEFLFPGKTQYDQSKNALIVPNERLIDSLSPLSWLKTAKKIIDISPDVVIMQWWQPFMSFIYSTIAYLVKKKKNCNLIIQCHNIVPHEHTVIDPILTRLALFKADALLVHSQSDAIKAKKLFPKKVVKVAHLPLFNVFPKGSENPLKTRKILEISPEQRVILFFGHIRKYKGLKVLLLALTKILYTQRPVLLIVGEFYEKKKHYLKLIQQNKLNSYVRIIDRYVPNEMVYKYFEIADAVILPYLSASQSAVIPLAWHFSRPIVATRIGGLSDLIASPENGLLVEPNNPQELANAIKQVLNPEIAAAIKQNMARNPNLFSWENMIKQMENLIQ